jgi:hypothetical protein
MTDGGASGPFKRQTSNQMTLNETKQSNQQSALSGNKKFAEDVDEESDEDSSEDHGPTVYMYKCPVFRTTLRLRTGEISSDNKPVFYVQLPSHTHPRRWVKRSVALLMETGR